MPIARSTLAQWVGQLGVSRQPLVDHVAEVLKQGTLLHADETPVQQLDRARQTNGSDRGCARSSLIRYRASRLRDSRISLLPRAGEDHCSFRYISKTQYTRVGDEGNGHHFHYPGSPDSS
ncbi:transposase [Accumulibacter sp.]|uniref:IS66 family transposase n=1 Tax=Accumulibacter sp. TaxID=2053492 RepID=UPI0028C396F0|nr:transposase [Accumulibacter sp.]